MSKKAPPPLSGALRDFYSDRRHEFLEAHQVQHPFEIVGQRRQAPFAVRTFSRPLSKKCVYPNHRLMRPEGMFGQRLPQLELLRAAPAIRAAIASIRCFVLLPRDRPVGLVPRALSLQRASLCSRWPGSISAPGPVHTWRTDTSTPLPPDTHTHPSSHRTETGSCHIIPAPCWRWCRPWARRP